MPQLNEHLTKDGMKHFPIDNSLRVFGKKFTMHILRNMILLKQKRFNEFIRSIEGINTKTLSIRLQEMEQVGLIKRKVLSRRPISVEYSLTKKGKALEPLLAQVALFSMQNEPKKIFKDERPRTLIQTYGTARLSVIWD